MALLRVIVAILFALIVFGFRSSTPKSEISSNYPLNIYAHDSLLFVSDSVAGILVYSISDIDNPQLKLVIPVKGNSGMAFKDSILYANSWGNILAIQILDDTLYKVHKILRSYSGCWEDCLYWGDCDGGSGCLCGADYCVKASPADGSYSGGGSYSVFAIVGSFLYYVGGGYLVAMDISDPVNPIESGRNYSAWNIETIYPCDGKLFAGTSTGVEIYSLSNPSNPVLAGSISHVRAYDPVFVKDTVAYSTIRSGSGWPPNTNNQLLSISVVSIKFPILLDSLSLQTPYGLTALDSFVYVANGYYGFSIINASNPANISINTSFATPNSRDFLVLGHRMLLMGMDGMYLYDVSNSSAPLFVKRF